MAPADDVATPIPVPTRRSAPKLCAQVLAERSRLPLAESRERWVDGALPIEFRRVAEIGLDNVV